MSPQPIMLTLKLKGLFCPCLESTTDRQARESVAWLQSRSSWRIQWHRPLIGGGHATQVPPSSSTKGGLDNTCGKKAGFTSFMSSLVQTVVSSTIGYSTVDARFSLVENEYGLAMRIVKLSTLRAEQRQQDEGDLESSAEDDGEESEKKGKNKRKERIILLRKISTLEPCGHANGLVVYGLGECTTASAGGKNPIITKGKELVRFDLLSSSKTDDEMSDLRDEFIDRIVVLIEWERKRFLSKQSQNSGDDNDETTLTQETDEDGEPIHRNIAQRAAHFAKRELEMAHTKRERESRKAKYMAASGGLKYTALAMASRAEIS